MENKFVQVWNVNDFETNKTLEDSILSAKDQVEVNNEDTTDAIYICKIIKVVEAKQKITVKDVK